MAMDGAQEPRHCWDFWGCSQDNKEKCLAYRTDSGRDCYIIASYFAHQRVNGYKDCFECEWFKKLNYGD